MHSWKIPGRRLSSGLRRIGPCSGGPIRVMARWSAVAIHGSTRESDRTRQSYLTIIERSKETAGDACGDKARSPGGKCDEKAGEKWSFGAGNDTGCTVFEKKRVKRSALGAGLIIFESASSPCTMFQNPLKIRRHVGDLPMH